jgi:uncharacterized protein YcbK (DUF882 family)|tara:strand:+ start:3496 stop:3897 length:402 start_codon:yes stop_codon:yes gene_type:complete
MILYDHHEEIRRGFNVWPWPHFSPKEIASRGNGSVLVVPEAMDILERAREIAGKPFKINSSFRDRLHNARVGGAPKSAHRGGLGLLAFDISLRGHEPRELLDACRRAGFTGFGFYRTFLHADTGRKRSWGSWL